MINDEKITVSPIGSPAQMQPYARKQFYDEQFAGEASSLAVHVVGILLFDSKGDLIVQKRSHIKNHNPGLVDKSIGGHITFGDTPDYTVMVESVQELSTPSIVLRNEQDFSKTLRLLRSYTDTISIVQHTEVKEWQFDKLHEGEKKPITNVLHLYFGVYDGRMRPADKEAAGMLYYSFERLSEEIAEHPEMFTDDLIKICEHYRQDIVAFQESIAIA